MPTATQGAKAAPPAAGRGSALPAPATERSPDIFRSVALASRPARAGLLAGRLPNFGPVETALAAVALVATIPGLIVLALNAQAIFQTVILLAIILALLALAPRLAADFRAARPVRRGPCDPC